jgi:hypothetical protein
MSWIPLQNPLTQEISFHTVYTLRIKRFFSYYNKQFEPRDAYMSPPISYEKIEQEIAFLTNTDPTATHTAPWIEIHDKTYVPILSPTTPLTFEQKCERLAYLYSVVLNLPDAFYHYHTHSEPLPKYSIPSYSNHHYYTLYLVFLFGLLVTFCLNSRPLYLFYFIFFVLLFIIVQHI